MLKNVIGGNNTITSSKSVYSIFTITFLDRVTQFDILDLLLLGDIHYICHNKLFLFLIFLKKGMEQ